ncbi:multidrug effflux MFS transporter [Stenotrophomonas terrae]|uniref:multidrug effflux MFS transporter n=1 Tax=Stenotrophomonas terrae TaxID=405446 RepID=UPI00320BAD8C
MSILRPRSMPLVLAALCATGPLGIDMYLPSIPTMANDFGTSAGAIQFSLMTFFLGLMLGQLAYGPLSDKFGRKPLIHVGLAIFSLGSVGCALAGSIEQLHWLRFVQGLGGSIGMVIAFAIIKDAFSGAAMGKLMSMVLAVLGLCPVLAPLAGNALQSLESWRLIFWALAAWGVLVAIVVAVLLQETRSVQARAGFALGRTAHTYLQILRDKRFLPFAMALCIAQAGFFAYIAGSSTVFIRYYQLSPLQFSLLFALNAAGLVVAAILNPRLHARMGALKTYRIVTLTYFGVLATLLLAMLAGINALPLLCTGLFITVALLGLLMPTGSQLALMQQGQHAGTASALLGALQFGAGALITAVSGSLAHLGGIGLVTVMAACAALSAAICLLLFPRRIEA